MEDLLNGIPLRVEIDEQIIFHQLHDSHRAVWSLLLATGYLRVLNMESVGEFRKKVYTLSLTNMEVQCMFENMVKGWFEGNAGIYYNEFIHSLLNDNVRKMNTFMNKVALNTFSSFDSGRKPSGQAEPERFYHGFVLGMVVELSEKYKVRSNRESGYGRYDVMITPLDRTEKAFIFEFKVLDPDEDEETLEDTLANAHAQIEKKQYEAELTAEGFAPEQIRKYGFAFRGKEWGVSDWVKNCPGISESNRNSRADSDLIISFSRSTAYIFFRCRTDRDHFFRSSVLLRSSRTSSAPDTVPFWLPHQKYSPTGAVHTASPLLHPPYSYTVSLYQTSG